MWLADEDEAPGDAPDDAASAESEQVDAPVDDADIDEDSEAARQRRENVRIDVRLPMRLIVGGRVLQCRTRDLSATGVGFAVRESLEIEQRVEVHVEFEDWTLEKPSIVRFMRPILAGSLIGVEFDELEQTERERLVKLVFDMQRSQLQAPDAG